MVDFFRRHPVLFNLLLMAITSVILLMLAMWGLNIWTGHGKVQVVPDVSGMSLKEAMVTLQRCNLHAEVIDSVHNDQASRGSVVDQVPCRRQSKTRSRHLSDHQCFYKNN